MGVMGFTELYVVTFSVQSFAHLLFVLLVPDILLLDIYRLSYTVCGFLFVQ